MVWYRSKSLTRFYIPAWHTHVTVLLFLRQFNSSHLHRLCLLSLSTPTSASGTCLLGSATWRTKRRGRNTCTRWVSGDKKPGSRIYPKTPFMCPTSLFISIQLDHYMPCSLGTTCVQLTPRISWKEKKKRCCCDRQDGPSERKDVEREWGRSVGPSAAGAH